MAQKNSLQGFSNAGTSGNGNLAGVLKNLGKMLTTKGVRPVGGDVKGHTGGTGPASGDPKMKPIATGKSVGEHGGQGPKHMASHHTGAQLKTHDVMGKSGVGKKDVRRMP